ncbi:MAG: SpoIVB peptidase [Defluviitaleaceae bacterium]|nr:SpoIVB peptidase [Defluviitaleaceae bacterium]
MRQKFKTVILLFISVAIGFIVGNAAFLMRLPSTIRLVEFTTHTLDIGLPLSATFSSETMAVAKVNDYSISDGPRLRLSGPVMLHTQGQGYAEMTIEAFGLPLRRVLLNVVPETKVVPLGTAIGVRINTDGVMVLGTSSFPGTDGETHRPSDEILRGGDLIISADGVEIKTKEALSEHVANSVACVVFTLLRDDIEIEVTVSPEEAANDNTRRIGAWVRDSTKGIGTLTFYNPANGSFGALGHGIVDVDTKRLMSVQSGIIMPSTVTSVKRGARGAPGELEGSVNTNQTIGVVTKNCPSGIYGKLDYGAVSTGRAPMPIALRSQIQEGPATILTNVAGTKVQEFEITIENVNRFTTDETKGMVIRITDPTLLKITGGIVQGMSGSPILQDGRVIGAVTHVFVQDPTKGYGIFIENMVGEAASS